MIKNYKHIIWDWNGTLLNDVDYCKNIINRILVQNKLPELSLKKYREIFTFPVQKYYEAAGLDFSKKSFEVLGKDFIDEYEKKKLSCSLFEKTIDVLSAIHKKGIGQSVLSAYLHDNLVRILDHYNLTKYFNHIIGLDNIYAGSKTHLGLLLVDKLNLPTEKVLFVGDTLHDYEVAEAMGVNSILIADGHQTKARLNKNGILVLDNLFELKNYLKL
ncbi:MAG TPA: HAD family hydrolase [Ignavibacteriaceae bacterium]